MKAANAKPLLPEIGARRQELSALAFRLWEREGKPGCDPAALPSGKANREAFDDWRHHQAMLALGCKLSTAADPQAACNRFASHLHRLERSTNGLQFCQEDQGNLARIKQVCEGFRNEASWFAYASAISAKMFKCGIPYLSKSQMNTLERVLNDQKRRQPEKVRTS